MKNRSPAATPLRILFTIGAAGAMSDGDLLCRYLDGRADEAECAFAVLVDRHGAMVRHVCLSILGNPEDAADAYQATFLVLARRAGAIQKAGSVGPWLFGVARRVALRARSRTSRRRQAERSLADHSATQPTQATADPAHADDWAVLYDELDRLPPRYRDPLVLCYLQGMTHDQASARLGIPTPTLRTRLSRARDRLRPRLVRRGLTPSSASSLLLAPVPLTSPASSLASIGWASAASRLAVASRGASLASLSVPLATSTLRSMLMISAFRTLALGGIALLGIGVGAAGFNTWENDGPEPVPNPPGGISPALVQSPSPKANTQPDAQPPSLEDIQALENQVEQLFRQRMESELRMQEVELEIRDARLRYEEAKAKEKASKADNEVSMRQMAVMVLRPADPEEGPESAVFAVAKMTPEGKPGAMLICSNLESLRQVLSWAKYDPSAKWRVVVRPSGTSRELQASHHALGAAQAVGFEDVDYAADPAEEETAVVLGQLGWNYPHWKETQKLDPKE